MSKGWLWRTFSEPLTWADATGLAGFAAGQLGWIIGPPSVLSHVCALMAGICLGLVHRDRQQRAHNRRMKELQRNHDALMAQIPNMDLQTLVILSKQADLVPKRRCPRCGLVTWNSTDIKEGYCGECRDWTQ